MTADKPFMEPRKDYEDYSRFINDTYADEKIQMLSQTVDSESKKGAFSKFYNPTNTLRAQSSSRNDGYKKGFNTSKHHRHFSINYQTETEKLMGSSFAEFEVKPKILESKIS